MRAIRIYEIGFNLLWWGVFVVLARNLSLGIGLYLLVSFVMLSMIVHILTETRIHPVAYGGK